MKKINIFLAAMAFFALLFSSCSNLLDEKSDDGIKYGNLIIGSENRALVSGEIAKADVYVRYGTDSADVTEKVNTSVSNGVGRVEITGIPVGKNRVVIVQAYSSTAKIEGVTLYAVVDINSGSNTLDSVTWETSKKGIVYNALWNYLDAGSLTSEQCATIENSIPTSVSVNLINSSGIASDYKAGTLRSKDMYVLEGGTVNITAYGLTGKKIQISDPSSEVSSAVNNDEENVIISNVTPGTWNIYIGETKSSKKVTVTSGNTTSITLGTKPFNGIQIQVAKSLGYNQIHYWDCSDKATYPNTKWPGIEINKLTDSDYIYEFENCSKVSLLITKDSGDKLCGDVSITKQGAYRITSAGYTESTYIDLNGGGGDDVIPAPIGDAVKIYVKASSAPSIWIWQPDGLECTKTMGYTWDSQPKMKSATDMKDGTGWYYFEIPSENYTQGKAFSFILNSGSTTVTTTKTSTFYYNNGTYYDEDPTTPPEPVLPTVKITPADGSTIALNRSISVTFTNGNDTITSAKVSVNGGSPYDMGTNPTTWTKSLSELGITASGANFTVSASVTNSKGTTTQTVTLTTKEAAKEDPFTWDNVLCYFVLTDRFYNGDTTNDASYYRTPLSSAGSVPTVALFHGGDIKGLTQKIDYFDNLGVNAIWITAPYEQAHGWVGGKNGAFPHYAFHGYYTLDWTAMDQNMGTIEEFREFVNACHSKGIRVVMDVVMNHVGYNNTEDMITYNHGYTDHKNHGWLATTDGKWDANDTVKWDNSYWDSTWYGPWIRSFGYDSGSEYGGSCGGLPDVKTELTSSVGMAPVLVTKWGQDSSDVKNKYYNPSVGNVDWNEKSGDWRTDKGVAPADYQVMWLSAWVREFGVDGFRCDTAKHVEPFRWGQLKVACQSALEAWRNDASKSKKYNGEDTGAADWDENFWMTGEYFGWTSTAGQGDYYTTGKFDSMINFSFNGSSGNTGRCPTTSDWSSYININQNADSDSNGNRNNVLSYVSSHDTGLHRSSGAVKLGTYLGLLPGGVQIYYGDESDREEIDGLGDADMKTRGDMNFLKKTDSKIKHWSRIGNFRKYNPAVGAGTGSAYKRSYSGLAGESKVAISINSTSVDVSGLFSDGTTVYNWYDGNSTTVSGGKVTFSGGTETVPILVSDKNPNDYGITF